MTSTEKPQNAHDSDEPGTNGPATAVDASTLAAFEDRYGEGSHARLTALLGRPCVTFAHVAERFGVTRELVRQWHSRFLPDAPTGHERQRLCVLYQRRRRLFQDPVFRSFFRHARDHFGPGRIEPIRSRDGYRLRSVRVDTKLVALRDGTDLAGRPGPPSIRYRGAADFVFVRLPGDEFLFIPTRVRDRTAPLRNSFAAFESLQKANGVVQEHPQVSF